MRNCLLILLITLCLTACAKSGTKTLVQESQSTDITSESHPESEIQITTVTAETVTAETATEETPKGADISEYILPESDSRLYTREELSKLSDADLRLARNEIFARHGRTFADNDLQLYFDLKSWYVPQYTPEEFEQKGDIIFNEFERTNRNLIVAIEQRTTEDIFADLTFYGDRIFSIASYTIEGDTIKLTGDICDSGFASKEYLMSLKPGDEIEDYGTVIEVSSDGHVTTELEVPFSDYSETVTYYLSSDGMSESWSMGGEGVIQRPVKQNITLIYDTKTEFIPVADSEPFNKPFLQLLDEKHYGGEEFRGWRVHLKQTTGYHIDVLEDLGFNYAG